MPFDAEHAGQPWPLRRLTNPRAFNAIANDPEVRPGLGAGVEPLDLAVWVEDLRNYAFGDERGGFVFVCQGDGRYELHTLLAPSMRGAAALKACARALRFMFVETDCTEIVTRVPGNLRAADLWARRAGFREVWTLANGWPAQDGPVALRLFAMTLDEWMGRDATLIDEGHAFHALLQAAADEEGDTAPLHPHDDDEHERAAGMACLMAKAGNTRKALWAYSRWAVLAGYRPLQLISETPAVFDVGNALVMARSGSLEVLKWLRQQ